MSENSYEYQMTFDDSKKDDNGSSALAVTGFVFSTLGFVGTFFLIGIPFGVAGLIISIIALVKNKKGKGLAITGTILSGLAVAISAIILSVAVPIGKDMFEFLKDAPTVVENYQENGSLPEYIEKYREDYPEVVEQFMNEIIKEYEKDPEAFENLAEELTKDIQDIE